jgi:hypothetical protein
MNLQQNAPLPKNQEGGARYYVVTLRRSSLWDDVWELAVVLRADEYPDTGTYGNGVCANQRTELRSNSVERVRTTVVHGVEVRRGRHVSGITTNQVQR